MAMKPEEIGARARLSDSPPYRQMEAWGRSMRPSCSARWIFKERRHQDHSREPTPTLGVVRLFIGEAKLVADLVHENIVQVYDLGILADGKVLHRHGVRRRAQSRGLCPNPPRPGSSPSSRSRGLYRQPGLPGALTTPTSEPTGTASLSASFTGTSHQKMSF